MDPQSRSYSIDNTAPVIDGSTAIPPDGTNTAFAAPLPSQPLAVKITDDRSGVKASGVVFSLTDTSVTPASTTNYTGNAVNYYSAVSFAQAQASLVAGHAYRVTTTAADYAGNQSAPATWSFTAVKVTVPSVAAKIPPTKGTPSEAPLGSTTRTFTFSDVPVHLPSFNVDLTGPSAHDGWGYVGQSVNLTAARIHLYKVGVDGSYTELPTGSPINAPASWGSRMMYAQVTELAHARGSRSLPVQNVSASIPQLTVSATALADAAVVEMTTSTTPLGTTACPRSVATACPSNVWPSTDPFPYHLADSEGDRIIAALDDEIDKVAEYRNADLPPGADPVCNTVNRTNCREVIDPEPIGYSIPIHIDAQTEQWVLTDATPQSVQDAQWGLHYLGSFPIFSPKAYSADCAKWLSCSPSAARDNATYGSGGSYGSVSQTWCLGKTEQLDPNAKSCGQVIYLGLDLGDSSDFPDDHHWHDAHGSFYASIGLNGGKVDQATLAVDSGSASVTPEWYTPNWNNPTFGLTGWHQWVLTDSWGDRDYCDPRVMMGCPGGPDSDADKAHDNDNDTDCVLGYENPWMDPDPPEPYRVGGLGTTLGLFSDGDMRDSAGNLYTGLTISPTGKSSDPRVIQHYYDLSMGDRSCAPNRAAHNMTFETSILGTFGVYPPPGTADDVRGAVGYFYGHNGTYDHFEWDCGAQIQVYPPPVMPGFQCGWTYGSSDKRIWSVNVTVPLEVS